MKEYFKCSKSLGSNSNGRKALILVKVSSLLDACFKKNYFKESTPTYPDPPSLFPAVPPAFLVEFTTGHRRAQNAVLGCLLLHSQQAKWREVY